LQAPRHPTRRLFSCQSASHDRQTQVIVPQVSFENSRMIVARATGPSCGVTYQPFRASTGAAGAEARCLPSPVSPG